jgi:hypothetical protein
MSSTYSINVTPSETRTYSITELSDANCIGDLSKGDMTGNPVVTVSNTTPTGAISGTTSICNGSSTMLTVQLTGNAPWSLVYTDGTTPVTVSYIASNTYTVMVRPTNPYPSAAKTTTYSIVSTNDLNCQVVGNYNTGAAAITGAGTGATAGAATCAVAATLNVRFFSFFSSVLGPVIAATIAAFASSCTFFAFAMSSLLGFP